MYNWCIAFPGREAVLKGMNDSFYRSCNEIRLLYKEAGEYLKKDLSKLCYSNSVIPNEWENICLITHCYSIYKVIIQRYGLPGAVAGYSQGEFTAATAAGVFSFPEVLELIHKLESLLRSEKGESECMYRLIDIETSLLEDICNSVDRAGLNVCISSYISHNQNIISGKRKYVDKVIDLAKVHGARWAIDLKTDMAYHSPLCNHIRNKAEKLFLYQKLNQATFPVYSCLDGDKSPRETLISEKLSLQINHPIQWNRIVKDMINSGFATMIELGPGCTVCANTRIADNRLNCRWIGSMDDL